MNSSISAYKELIVLFTNKKEISASKFEEEFLKLFKSDESCNNETYEIIKPLFYAVEDFCSSPELCDKDDLDENQLAKVAKTTLEKLEKLQLVDDKNIQTIETEVNVEQLLVKLCNFMDILPVFIEKTIEEKLNDILPPIVKNTVSEELYNINIMEWDIDTKYYTDKDSIVNLCYILPQKQSQHYSLIGDNFI